MYISAQTKQAYTEIDNFIELLAEEDRNKIPKKLRQFFKEEKDDEYIKAIDIDIPIKEQNLKEETLALIALLNIKYICDDVKEKERLTRVYHDNDIRYQEILKEKYNPDNIFKNKDKHIDITDEMEMQQKENVQLVKYEEIKWYKKIFIKILNIFKK